jgi:hypothetical protein
MGSLLTVGSAESGTVDRRAAAGEDSGPVSVRPAHHGVKGERVRERKREGSGWVEADSA